MDRPCILASILKDLGLSLKNKKPFKQMVTKYRGVLGMLFWTRHTHLSDFRWNQVVCKAGQLVQTVWQQQLQTAHVGTIANGGLSKKKIPNKPVFGQLKNEQQMYLTSPIQAPGAVN